MIKIASNRLLLVSIIVVLVYWATASLTPNPYLSIANNILLFFVSGIGLWRYREKTADILFRQDRGDSPDRGYGGYLAIYGIFLVFMGSFYGAIYSSTWIFMGEPQSWIGSSYAQFGRFLSVCGFACMAFSPDLTKEGFILPDRLWATVLVVISLLAAGFYVGTKVDTREIVNVATCPSGSILGTSRKTYHTMDSPYRAMVTPRFCFRTVAAAEAAGFRAPRSSSP